MPVYRRAHKTRKPIACAVALLIAAAAAAGCAVQPQTTAAPQIVEAPAWALPFKGRLAQGDPGELPPDVAASLANDSPVTFMYREELTHDEHHPPLLSTAFAPSTYSGAALGEYGVTAFASLSITDGDRILADYTAEARVTRSYSLFSAPTHQGLERAARAAVRRKIDEKLESDAGRLAQAIAAPPAQPGAPTE